jgi:hypothetical protein
MDRTAFANKFLVARPCHIRNDCQIAVDEAVE